MAYTHLVPVPVNTKFKLGDNIVHKALSGRADCANSIHMIEWRGGGPVYVFLDGTTLSVRREDMYELLEG